MEGSKILVCYQGLTLYHTIRLLTSHKTRAFEKIVGKGENAGNQHFILFPQCFLPYQGEK